jgi:halocyanin-like protein
MKPSDTEGTFTRRGLLKTGAGAAAAGVAASAGAGAASAQSEPYGGYLSDANLFRGTTADRTGQDSVTVQVGAGDGGLAFSPPAIVVDPGTTVTWEWTGNGGGHNVIHDPEAAPDFDEEAFNSGQTVSEAGFTFEFTFEEQQAGWHPYFCSPHQALGMLGVVAVGIDNAQGQVGEPEEIELLSTASIFGGAAVGGGVTLLGLAYRGLYGDGESSE